MSNRFNEKVVFITGASSGIGRATALAFAREGALLALAARRVDRLEAIKTEIEALGSKALSLICDVTDRESLDTAVQETIAHFGHIDVVIANAGFGVSGAATKLDTPDYRRQFETNVFGVLDTLYATLPHLESSKGHICFLGSVMGRMGLPASAPYNASKFAVVGLAESLYYDLREKGIGVSVINPGWVESEFRSVDNQGVRTVEEHEEPIPRWLVYPAEKAAADIVNTVYKRRFEAVITGHGKVAVFFARHFPRSTRWFIGRSVKGRIDKVERAKRGKLAQ